MSRIVCLVALVARALTACGGVADTTPAPPPPAPSCAMDADYDAASICPTPDFAVVFCTAPIPSPGGIECSPTRGQQDPRAASDTWCCK